MIKKRRKILETRYFGLIIGAIVIVLFLSLDLTTKVFSRLNTIVVDTQFTIKNSITATSSQEGVLEVAKNPMISDDLVIIGIDSKTLSRFGKWPFSRSVHADFLDSLARIKEQSERENSILFDVFIYEADKNVADDARFVRSIQESGTVFMETVMEENVNDFDIHEQMLERQRILTQKFGSVTKVTGPWENSRTFEGIEAPLKPYCSAIAGYGHANYVQDFDEVYRMQALICKLSIEQEQIRLDTLKEGFTVDKSSFERLAWTDSNGISHNIQTPLSEASLKKLKKVMRSSAPTVLIDEDANGEPEDEYYVVRKYQDSFIPSITLSMALKYFDVPLSQVEVVYNKYIRIPHPSKVDPATGKRVPYLPELIIPINEHGEMMVNYMGYRSSSSPDGYQTFPVRSYANYADRAPGTNPETWPKTKAFGNKIIMVGAFADGMAQDEKPTPFGLMYGIEIHTNALNTILMNNFLRYIPKWIDVLIFIALVLVIAFLCSRISTLWSFITLIIGLMIYFLATSFIFEYSGYILDYSKPALAMIITLVAVIAYRAMTEEQDKKQIRETFGKYVSPKVVDQLMMNPPELGGVDKEITVFFSDIRGFTTLSENMTPQQLVNHLNEYLTAMTDIIHEYSGTLDKYVGDEVMCFWGAPLPQAEHAVLACKCALRQMEKLRELNAVWPETKRINIGIGLNSGIMTVGNMGSPGRMNYTLMGDNVNLGARLEGTNKQYGTNIIISEFTYGLVKDHFVVRELDNIRVKGKNKPVLIYELVDCIEPLSSK